MNIKLVFKKLGNHWYPNVNHDDINDLMLTEKVERILSLIDKNNKQIVTLDISEQNTILYPNTIQFRDEDILRYFTTNDYFNFKIYIGDVEFEISSSLYFLLEELYNFNFHKTLYSCTII